MQSTLFFALFLGLAFFLGGSFQAPSAEPSVTLTVNTTFLAVGGTVKLTCTLHNYALDSDRVLVVFYQDGTYMADYAIIKTSEGTHEVAFIRDSLGPHPLSSSFPLYEITLTPTLAGTHAYSCTLNNLQQTYAESGKVSITTKDNP